ncbi:MAG: type II toxin-antitoxin system VapC family toxin [Pirellulales bacterium]|nr:type II toxin-antitoxin system VapC family toxin [Pirellulales bacterium]
MTTLVVDASVVAKWFFPEVHAAEARRLLSSRYELVVPSLLWCEVGNMIWKRVRRGELAADEAVELSSDLGRMPLQVADVQPLLAAALELAIATDRTVYDCTYLALALERHCRLITADDRFFNALASTPLAKHVRHVTRLR